MTQREFKFRAWDPEDKSMDGPFDLSDLINQQLPGEWFGNYDEFLDDNLIFMQFTGLLDKNGMEIFEDDYVKIKSGIYQLSWRIDPQVGFFLVNNFRNIRIEFGKFMSEGIEIIGNIHQNPEILNEY